MFEKVGAYNLGGANQADITRTSYRATFFSLENQDEAWLAKDFGSGRFGADLNIQFTIYVSAISSTAQPFIAVLADDGGVTVPGENPDAWTDIDAAGAYALGCQLFGLAGWRPRIVELHGGTVYNSATISGCSLSTAYYARLSRSQNASTATLYIYSDAARTNLVGSAALTLHSIRAYDWAYAIQSYHAGSTQAANGYIENFDLGMDDYPIERGTPRGVARGMALGVA